MYQCFAYFYMFCTKMASPRQERSQSETKIDDFCRHLAVLYPCTPGLCRPRRGRNGISRQGKFGANRVMVGKIDPTFTNIPALHRADCPFRAGIQIINLAGRFGGAAAGAEPIWQAKR